MECKVCGGSISMFDACCSRCGTPMGSNKSHNK